MDKFTEYQLNKNRLLLIQKLEGFELFDNRYKEIKCINCDRKTGKPKRGGFSIVFKAYDIQLEVWVALKFFDPNISYFNTYRILAFQREPEILKKLINRKRCLQLVSDLKTYHIPVVDNESGMDVTLECQYFAIDWIENKIDQYFEKQEQYNAKDKLIIFDNIVLAVAALHRHEVSHRDIKYDNLREYSENLKKLVVAIDLGCAAYYEIPKINVNYSEPVGHKWYSSPESYCGLAGDCSLSHYTDIYALGCLLFEMFNMDFYYHVLNLDDDYKSGLGAIIVECMMLDNVTSKKEVFLTFIKSYKVGMAVPDICQPGNTVPNSISDELNYLLKKLTAPDPADRIDDLNWVSRRIKTMIKIIDHNAYQQKRIMEKKKLRELRVQKYIVQQTRLQQHLENNFLLDSK